MSQWKKVKTPKRVKVDFYVSIPGEGRKKQVRFRKKKWNKAKVKMAKPE